MTALPGVIYAGDTVGFSVDLADYPASAGWVLKYRLAPRSAGTARDVTSTASGDTHVVSVAATTTVDWAAGFYTWTAFVEQGTERYTVGRGQLEIRAASSTLAAGTDTRTHARKVLDAIEAVLENRATLDQEEYAINGRSLKRTPLVELLRLRQLYRNEVRGEDAATNLAAGIGGGGKVQVRL